MVQVRVRFSIHNTFLGLGLVLRLFSSTRVRFSVRGNVRLRVKVKVRIWVSVKVRVRSCVLHLT